jgi:hypothetical protein
MSAPATGCAAAACDGRSHAPRAIANETVRNFGVALLVAFGVCALVGRLVSFAAPRPAPLNADLGAELRVEQNARRELVGELIDPPRILSLVAESGMTPEEAVGALRLARRAAIGGGSADKARSLGAVIARLEADTVIR